MVGSTWIMVPAAIACSCGFNLTTLACYLVLSFLALAPPSLDTLHAWTIPPPHSHPCLAQFPVDSTPPVLVVCPCHLHHCRQPALYAYPMCHLPCPLPSPILTPLPIDTDSSCSVLLPPPAHTFQLCDPIQVDLCIHAPHGLFWTHALHYYILCHSLLPHIVTPPYPTHCALVITATCPSPPLPPLPPPRPQHTWTPPGRAGWTSLGGCWRRWLTSYWVPPGGGDPATLCPHSADSTTCHAALPLHPYPYPPTGLQHSHAAYPSYLP